MSILGEDAECPIQALAERVEAELVAAGITTPHVFGSRGLTANMSPPRYVWVPTRTLSRREIATRTRDDYRPIAHTAELIELHCWGVSFAQTWALRCNAVVAARRLAEADLRIESGEWVRPAAAWNQDGEVYILSLSLVVPTLDVYIDPGASPMRVPPTDGVVPVDVHAQHILGPDLTDDGDGEVVIDEF